jgi:hypothetical protein
MCWEENGDSVHVQCITIEELRIYYEQKKYKKEKSLTALALATN